ncbi:23390_t:CDS:1 [Cetraspora pellucida]|uniref:23390_t:CDS:1 n=1 Tax=Cetraspora pellucida TaxID=1433469 RepID=A0A9N9AM00_9GLOM|nr:23390_t:CDS:1 [Cetraspora pellucida]
MLAMFERYLHLHLAIHEICSKEPLMPLCLDNEGFINLESFCQLLKPFASGTLVLSKENSNSISDAIMVILEIDQHINKVRISHYIKRKFEKYWNVIVDHVIIAHILDPRYKLKHLKATLIEVGNYSKNNTEVFVNNIWQKIILYGMKYASTETSTVETVEKIEIVESNDNYMSDFLIPRRKISKK